jgi:hypothetical protein
MGMRPVLLLGAAAITTLHAAADPPVRRPLDPAQRTAVLALMHAVDVAQDSDVTSDAIAWDGHALKASNQTAYVPFRVELKSLDNLKSAALYLRAVSRHDGYRSSEERSMLREWVERGGGAPPSLQQSMRVAPGDMPVGGPGMSSSRQSIQASTEASTVLSLQQRQFEKEKAEADAAKQKKEAPQRNPTIFPFEEYYFADVKARAIERALALPPGEYDLFVAIVDRSRIATSSPTVMRRTVKIHDYWNDELSLSPVILVKEFRQLKAPLAAKDQAEHPYTFGATDVVPVATATFATSDALIVLYQICNYGAPDSDVVAEYNFYHQVGGKRTLFNRTQPQALTDAELPGPADWSTQGFVTQTVPLAPFPSDRYELEIVARDRLTRRTATTTVEFTVR